MTDVTQLLRGAAPPRQDQAPYGIVSHGQPAPTTFDSPLYVVLPDFSPDIYWTCTYWPAIHGGSMPLPGAEVLIIFDDRDNPRCVWWAGAYSPPPVAVHAYTATALGS